MSKVCEEVPDEVGLRADSLNDVLVVVERAEYSGRDVLDGLMARHNVTRDDLLAYLTALERWKLGTSDQGGGLGLN